MIIAMRSLLLDGDCNKCNLLLVSKYPQTIDVKFVLALALYVQEPMCHPYPSRSPFKFGLPYLQDLSSTSSKAPGKSARRTTGAAGSAGSAGQRSKRRFNSYSAENSKKMVDLSGNGVDEPVFEFLGGELSPSNADRENMFRWKEQLTQSYSTLKKHLTPNESPVQEALGKMETVLADMSVKLRLWNRGDSVGIDALEIVDAQEAKEAKEKEEEEERIMNKTSL